MLRTQYFVFSCEIWRKGEIQIIGARCLSMAGQDFGKMSHMHRLLQLSNLDKTTIEEDSSY